MATKKPNTDEPTKLPNISKAEKKKLFEAAEKEQKAVDAAREALDAATLKRSGAVRTILEKCGTGPFNYKNRVLTVTKRKHKDVGEDPTPEQFTYYFKSPSKNEIEDI